jgi:hypothetical protein
VLHDGLLRLGGTQAILEGFTHIYIIAQSRLKLLKRVKP